MALPRLPHCHNPKAIMVIVPQNEAKPIPAKTATTATVKIDFREHCHDCHDCHVVVEGVDAAASTAARLPRLPRCPGVLGIDLREDCHDCHGAAALPPRCAGIRYGVGYRGRVRAGGGYRGGYTPSTAVAACSETKDPQILIFFSCTKKQCTVY